MAWSIISLLLAATGLCVLIGLALIVKNSRPVSPSGNVVNQDNVLATFLRDSSPINEERCFEKLTDPFVFYRNAATEMRIQFNDEGNRWELLSGNDIEEPGVLFFSNDGAVLVPTTWTGTVLATDNGYDAVSVTQGCNV
jgi:hypothetical protein